MLISGVILGVDKSNDVYENWRFASDKMLLIFNLICYFA